MPGCCRVYAPSVRAHSETVLRSFYDFHQEAGTGPLVNPFPLDRSRRGGRAHAHHNPMEPFHPERSGLYRPAVPSRIPRSVPDEEFNEIFAALGSHRDRALVAFYVSTGARASELLSVSRGGVDPGRQLITVVRKGTREMQQLPASSDAFVWLRLYQLETDGKLPRGSGQPLWWTLRRPFRPLTYHGVHRMFERAGAVAGTDATLHSLRHTAAYRFRGPGFAADRCAAGAGSCSADDHAAVSDAPQGRRDPPDTGSPWRAGRSGPAAGATGPGAGLPAREPGCAVRERGLVTAASVASGPAASVWLAGYAAARTRFPPRPATAQWPATAQSRDQVAQQLAGQLPGNAGGLEALLDWLAGQDGGSWQQRWLASGADAAGAAWWQLARDWLHRRSGHPVPKVAALVSALVTAICADIVRPSLAWLAAGGRDHGELARAMAVLRDPEGFARLRALCDSDPAVSKTAGSRTQRRAAVILAARGGVLAGITVGDVLELLDTEAQVHGAAAGEAAACYRLLRQMRIFGPAAPERLRQLRTAGQRTPEEMIDRHQLACQPIRDLLVDYLRERQPAIDYGSLEQLARKLGMFWADLEAHHPGIDSLHLSAEVADAWKQRLRTKQQTITSAAGAKTVIDAERICHREFLTPVRAFYLDLAQWAVDDPSRWGPWVAPCPVGRAETIQGKVQRHRKSRMDARTRERLPVLPVLARSAARQHADAQALLQAARDTRPGRAIPAPGTALARSVTGSNAAGVWADDPATGKRRNLTAEEGRAFWAWATIEVLRATGIRIEELVQLSHHSFVQYHLPSTGELVPLLQIVPSKTDAERLLVISPELADVLSAIISRIRGTRRSVPLVAAYDDHERVWLPPAPVLFQRRIGAEDRAIPGATVRKILTAALARTGLTDPAGAPLRYTPHDFRRMFLTDVS